MDFNLESAIAAAIARKTDFERAEEEKYQRTQQAALSNISPIDARAELGKRMVAMAETALVDNPSEFELIRLAEGLAYQGHFALAVDITPDATKQQEYKQIVDALNGNPDCACPRKQGTISTRFTKDTILVEGRPRDLIACSLCGNVIC
jgi:hypothetical protein